MAKFYTLVILAVVATTITALPQRNRPFPTTAKPAPWTTTTSATTTSTAASAPYPAAGFRPGRAFELPTEEKSVTQPGPSYGPPARDGRANEPAEPVGTTTAQSATPVPTTPSTAYGPPAREGRAKNPAPVAPTRSYGPPARDGRAFTPPPSVDPLPSYLPPVDKYGPPQDKTPTTTPDEPEFAEPTTPRPATPRALSGDGFYFIQLPNGFISRSGLPSVGVPEARNLNPAESLDDVEMIEPVTPSAPVAPVNPINPVARPAYPFAPVAPVSPAGPFVPTVQVQPAAPPNQGRSFVQYWPPRQPGKLVAVQPEKLVAAQPEVVVNSAEYYQPVEYTGYVQPWQTEALVETAEPFYYVQPQAYSYSSQYRSW